MSHKSSLMLMVTLVIVACRSSASIPVNDNITNTHLIFITSGEAKLKRTVWTDYQKVTSGAFLNSDDMLFPSSDARVVVLCDDLSIWLVPAGVQSAINNGCTDAKEPAIVRSDGNIGNTRGGVDPTVPYIIYPRASKILDNRPTLRWNPVPNANTYSVQIEYDGQVLWKTETNNTQLDYPGQPAIKPDTSYTLVVYSDTGKSSEEETVSGPLNEPTINLSFQLVYPIEAQELERLVETISSLQLSISDREYVISLLYSGRGFYSESMLLLEKIVMENPDNLYALFQLGNQQLSIGLPFLAKNNFESVIDKSSRANNLELQAMALEGLAKAYLNIGNRDEALQKMQEAAVAYKNLGDKFHAQELRDLSIKLAP